LPPGLVFRQLRQREPNFLGSCVQNDENSLSSLFGGAEYVSEKTAFGKIPVGFLHLFGGRCQPQHAVGAVRAPAVEPALAAKLTEVAPQRGQLGDEIRKILAGLAEIVEEVAGVAQDDVTAEKSFVDDLDIDSLSMVEIAVQAEDRFGVKIPDDELANLKTVGDAVNYVSANLK